MPNFDLAPYLRGLRPDEQAEGCVQFQNAMPYLSQALWCKEYLSDLPTALLTQFSNESITVDWPYPQIHHGKRLTFVCTEDTVYTMDRDTYALTDITPVDIYTGATVAIPAGGVWHYADFGDTGLLVNGSCAILVMYLLRDPSDFQYDFYIDTTFFPQTVHNHMGRLVMGGFGSASHHPAWESIFDHLNGSTQTAVTTLPTLNDGHVWWSSIGGQDMFQWFHPDSVLNSGPIDTRTEVCNDSGFAENQTYWTAGGADWFYSAGPDQWVHLVTGSTYLYQTQANQANPITVGDVYRFEVDVATTVSGSFTPYLGGKAGQTISAPGVYVQYISPDTADDVEIRPTSDFSGALNSIKVSKVDMTPFYELQDRGQSGHKYMDDDVRQVCSFGENLVVFTDASVWMGAPIANEVTPTFGWTKVSSVGILERGAVAVGEQAIIFVSSEGHVYRLSGEGVAKLGFKEFTEDIDTWNCHFDDRLNIAYLSGLNGTDQRTLVVTPEGAGLATFSITGGFEQDGLYYTYRSEDSGTEAPTELVIETSDIPLSASKEQVQYTDVRARDVDNITAYMKVRDDREGTTYLSLPNTTGALANQHGRVYLRYNANEPRIVLQANLKTGSSLKQWSMETKGIRR